MRSRLRVRVPHHSKVLAKEEWNLLIATISCLLEGKPRPRISPHMERNTFKPVTATLSRTTRI